MKTIEVWSERSAYQAFGHSRSIRSAVLFKVDHVGDFILALDSFTAFRSRFPDARLTLVCAPWTRQIAASLDIFDDIVAIEFFDIRADGAKKGFGPEIAQALPKIKFDLAVDLRVDPDTRVLLDHVDATYKCGYESQHCLGGLTVSLPWSLSASAGRNLGVHQSLLMLRLVHTVGDFFRMSPAVPELLRSKVAVASAFDLGFAAGRILVVCNTSSGRDAKNWPPDRFRALIRWLCHTMQVAVLLVGTKDQTAASDAIVTDCNSPLIASAVGKTSLAEAVHLVSQASMFIGNDSGLTHIAARLGLPTVDILSGIDPAAMWIPIGPNVTAIKAPVPCSPCHILSLSQCGFGHACIENISLAVVQAVVRKALMTAARQRTMREDAPKTRDLLPA